MYRTPDGNRVSHLLASDIISNTSLVAFFSLSTLNNRQKVHKLIMITLTSTKARSLDTDAFPFSLSSEHRGKASALSTSMVSKPPRNILQQLN